MFELFKKKSASPEERIAECHRKKDYVGLAKAYYELGKSAMEAGEQGRAMLWLGRADTVYSARDDVYDKVGEKLTEDCSNRICELEGAPLFINEIEPPITEQVNDLGDAQVRIWSLLSLARLVPAANRLAELPGCGVLGKLEKCLSLALQSFSDPITPDEFDFIMNTCTELAEFCDSEPFFAGGEVPCSAGAPLQVFDLNGMAMLLSIEAFFDGLLRTLAGQPVKDQGEMIPCALLPDYWQRTVGGDIRYIPQVQAELDRIANDEVF
ncbi:MAG: hypothetical protein K2K53_02645, partial [Oscillospiraceae bacterium]|nr:hypothetical protein [Oscillospiraceae bacterium]